MSDQVSITLLLFAKARELIGSSSVIITVPSTVTNYLQLLEIIFSEQPRLGRLGDKFVLSLNENYIDREFENLVLRGGDEIAVIPPISGG